MLAAGLDGIEQEIEPGEATEADLYKPGSSTKFLPGSLTEALDELEGDGVIMEAFGKQIMSNFLKIKREEVELYNSRPSNIDFDMYLDV